MTVEDLITAAVEWAEAGIRVFPCNSEKAPLTKNGHLDATDDPRKVKELFEFYGSAVAMIGGRMGNGIFAADFDTYKTGSAAEAYMNELQAGGNLPPTRIHKTLRGGVHMFFEGEVQDCKPVSGVEIKSDGGYVILPPTPGYEIVSRGIAKAPKGLIDSLTKARRANSMASVDTLKANIISASDFHDSIALLAAKLAIGGMDQVDITREVRAVLDQSLASSPHHDRHSRWKSIVGDRGGELSRIITSGYVKYNVNAPSLTLKEQPVEQVDARKRLAEKLGFAASPIVGEKKPEEYSDEQWPFTEGYFASDDYDLASQKFAMYPIFAENETVVLFAEPKVGKTAIALTTALSISCGLDLGAFKVTESGPTLYYALEGTRAIRLRVKAWRKKKTEEGVELPEQIPMFVVEGHVNFLKEERRRDEANKIIAANNYAIKAGAGPLKAVYLDTLTKAMAGGDQNSVEDTSHLFDLIGILRSGGVTATVVFVHHKSRQGNARGSTNIEAEPDVLLDVSKEGDTVELRVARARSIEDGGRFLFTLVGVDLGTTAQGHPLAGVYAAPIESDFDATELLSVGKTRAEQLTLVCGFGPGIHSLDVIVKALWEKNLIPLPTTKKTTKAPSPNVGYVQSFIHELVPDAGSPFGEYVLHPVVSLGKITAIRVGKVSY